MNKNILERSNKISLRHEALSNPLRVLILATVISKERVSWTEIVKMVGKVLKTNPNPNTVSFHLARLVDAGLVIKSGSTYSTGLVPKEMVDELSSVIGKA